MSLYENLLERLGGQEYNGYFSANCVFHNDSHPSMFVYESGTFRCSACHAHGSLKSLERKIGSHFYAYKSDTKSNILPQWSKWGDSLDEIAQNAHEMLKRYPQFCAYYKKRKIDEFINKGHLGYMSGWGVFPVFSDNGAVVNIVVRGISGKGSTRYVVSPYGDNRGNCLFVPNWKRVKDADVVYCVFGIVDCIGFELMEVPCVTGITGQSINPELLSNLHKRIIIVPDKGEEASAHKIANSLGWRCKVKELNYPDGTKDSDEVRRIYGNEYLLGLMMLEHNQ